MKPPSLEELRNYRTTRFAFGECEPMELLMIGMYIMQARVEALLIHHEADSLTENVREAMGYPAK